MALKSFGTRHQKLFYSKTHLISCLWPDVLFHDFHQYLNTSRPFVPQQSAQDVCSDRPRGGDGLTQGFTSKHLRDSGKSLYNFMIYHSQTHNMAGLIIQLPQLVFYFNWMGGTIPLWAAPPPTLLLSGRLWSCLPL